MKEAREALKRAENVRNPNKDALQRYNRRTRFFQRNVHSGEELIIKHSVGADSEHDQKSSEVPSPRRRALEPVSPYDEVVNKDCWSKDTDNWVVTELCDSKYIGPKSSRRQIMQKEKVKQPNRPLHIESVCSESFRKHHTKFDPEIKKAPGSYATRSAPCSVKEMSSTSSKACVQESIRSDETLLLDNDYEELSSEYFGQLDEVWITNGETSGPSDQPKPSELTKRSNVVLAKERAEQNVESLPTSPIQYPLFKRVEKLSRPASHLSESLGEPDGPSICSNSQPKKEQTKRGLFRSSRIPDLARINENVVRYSSTRPESTSELSMKKTNNCDFQKPTDQLSNVPVPDADENMVHYEVVVDETKYEKVRRYFAMESTNRLSILIRRKDQHDRSFLCFQRKRKECDDFIVKKNARISAFRKIEIVNYRPQGENAEAFSYS